jgi:hypothetical protein
MANSEQIEAAIEAALAQRKKSVLNRNALRALFVAFGNQGEALGQVFLGREDALEAERHRLQQERILELLVKIDAAIAQTASDLREIAGSTVLVQGLIEVVGEGTENVIGVHIAADAGPVEFQPGTHIRARAADAVNLTGLRVGGREQK